MRSLGSWLQSLRLLPLAVRLGIFLFFLAGSASAVVLTSHMRGGHSLMTLLMFPIAVAAWLFSARMTAFCLFIVYIVSAVLCTLIVNTLNWPVTVIVAFTFSSLIITAEACGISLLRYTLDRSQEVKQKELRAEQELAAVRQRQCVLDELKGQFFLNMSHELCTPLTELKGYIELLREHYTQLDSATQEKFLEHIAHGCTELEAIVGSVTEMAHLDDTIQTLHLERVNIASAVREALDHKALRILPEHTIHVQIAEALTAWTDRKQMQQVLSHLLSNALKYSPPRAPVIVSATLLSNLPDLVVPSVCIRVQDAGSGIPTADMPLLFSKGVRLRRDVTGNVRGSGLGLYMSKQVVEALGGRIWVESSGIPGQGSCFCFTLPCTAVPAPILSRTS